MTATLIPGLEEVVVRRRQCSTGGNAPKRDHRRRRPSWRSAMWQPRLVARFTYHERNADGLARLGDNEIRDIRQGERRIACPFEYRVAGNHRQHTSRHTVAEHKVILIVECQQLVDPVQQRGYRIPCRQSGGLLRRRGVPSGSRGRSARAARSGNGAAHARLTRPRISVAVRKWSGSRATLLSSGPLRTVRARHQAHGSSKPRA